MNSILAVLRRLLPTVLVAGAAFVLPASAQATPSPFPVTESFRNATVGSQWYTGGTALLTAPSIDANGSGWLRLTAAQNTQFGYIINDTPFPSSNGIDVSFDYASYGGNGADGLTFFLYDGDTTPESSFAPGPAGGSLGYASCPSSSKAGLTNGYVGVGFDEYGNYANNTFCGLNTGYGTPGVLQPNRVTVRGAAGSNPTAPTSYPYLTSVATDQSLVGSTRADARHVTVSITPDMKLAVYITYPNGHVQTVTSGYQLPPAPSNLKFGWVASTGGSTDYHEIRNSTVAEPADLQTTLVSGPTAANRTDTLSYSFKVTNVGQNDTTGNAITATTPGGSLQNVSWTCASATGTCATASGIGLPDTIADLPIGASATYTITGQATPSTDYGSLRLEADPTGATTQSVPNDNIATATTDLTPIASTAPTMSLSNTNGYTGVAHGTAGTYLGGDVTVTDTWQHCRPDGSSCADIPGATGLSYTTGAADRGSTLRLHEHAANGEGAIDVYTAAYSPLPQTSKTTTTALLTTQRTASFALSSDTAGVAYECKLDSGSWTACSASPAFTGLADGSHTFAARAVYAGLNDPTGATYGWTVDTTAPSDTSSCPSADGAHGWHVSALSCTVSGTDTNGINQVQYGIDSGPTQSGSSGASVSIPNGTHTLHTRVQDNAGNWSAWAATTVKVDTPAPVDSSDCGTPDGAGGYFIQLPTCAVQGSDSISGLDHVAYQLDGGSIVQTGVGTTTAGVPITTDGTHVLRTEVDNVAGVTSGWSTHTLHVDTIAPTAPVIVAPAANTSSSDTSPHVSVTGEPHALVTVEVDGSDYGPVRLDDSGAGEIAIPGPLSDGQHGVRAQQTDEAGNVGPWSDLSIWTVKTQTSVALLGPSAGPTNAATPTVDLRGEAGDQFVITVDGRPVATGVIPAGGVGSLTLPSALSDGRHTIEITSTDAAGNQATASVVVTVDTAAPSAPVTIGRAPATITASRTATFDFGADSSAVARRCSLDGVAWRSCSDPVTFSGLADGPHILLVQAIDAAGNVSASSEYAWTVKTTAPAAPTILGGPAPATLPSTSRFELSAAPGTTLQCSLDGGRYRPCPRVVHVPPLAVGSHSLAVRQVDEAGNRSAPRVYRWSVLRRVGPRGLPRAASLLVAPQTTAAAGSTLDVGCNINAGSIRRCSVIASYHGRPIGTGVVREGGRGHMRSVLHVRLTARGRRLLRRATGGLPVVLSATAHPYGFRGLPARARTILFMPMRFVIQDVLFDFDSATLTGRSRAVIADIAGVLRGARTVQCEGNTDSYGSRAYNEQLGLRRARAVCDALAALGVRARFHAVSDGADRPVATNQTDTGRHLNRRVVVRVSYRDLPRPGARWHGVALTRPPA